MSIRYSHPPEDGDEGVRLEVHLEDVADRVQSVVPEQAHTPAGEPLDTVVETLAYVHDFGKASTYFQQHLGVKPGNPDQDQFRYHAPIGSFAAYYALDARGFQPQTCLAGFVAVAKHHGRLPDVTSYVFDRAHRRENVPNERMHSDEKLHTAIAMQIQDIEDNVPDLATNVFSRATSDKGSWDEFRTDYLDLLNEIASHVATVGSVPGVNPQALSNSCYGTVLQCWSSLVLADKTSAAGANKDSETYDPEKPRFSTLDGYIDALEAEAGATVDGTRSECLDHFRSAARTSVMDNTKTFAEEKSGVATITLPTGMGKTLTGLSAALELRRQCGGERILYALPFTSIIDQVIDELKDIFDTDVYGRLLTAHHHLSDTTIRDADVDDEAADRNDDVAGMLAESWRAGLTVSTFVQLFESLAGPANSQSMKLPALHDSIVVLDEPQSLPLHWWKLVPRLIEILTERYGATVIAMTATQPQLFDSASELVDDPDQYFEVVQRVTYELDPSTERYLADREGPKSYGDAAGDLTDAVDGGESALAICNTIDSARELTNRAHETTPNLVDVAAVYEDELRARDDAEAVDPSIVAETVTSAGDRAIVHLSTRLRPADRLTLIETAKRLTEREYPLLTVSTQLVEAGVDISFDRVYRDLAPIDSIVQAAGRCNRSFEREVGRVTVWWLDAPGEQDKTPAEAVYNRDVALLPVVASALEDVRDDIGELTETAVARTAVEEYYRRLHEEKNVGKDEYVEYVDRADADALADLSLIDQRRSVEVFVTRTPSERELAEAIRRADRNYEYDELRRLLDETKPLRVSVPIYRQDSDVADAIASLKPPLTENGIYALDVDRPGSFFDSQIGFVVPDDTVEHRLL